MKKYFNLNILPLAILTVILTVAGGCKKSFTEIPLYGTATLENQHVFENQNGCLNYVTSCYTSINWDDWWQTEWVRLLFETATDDGWMSNFNQFGNATDYLQIGHWNGLSPTSGQVGDYWTMNYFGIQRCNVGIKGISDAPIDAGLRSRLVGELKFLRGWFYFELVKNWGGVPLYTAPRSANDAPKPRATKEEVYQQIFKDFQDAAAALPQRKNYSGNDQSRASKGAALAFLAKAYLWDGKWSQATQTAQQVMALGEYGLESDFGDIYQPMHYNGIESIFEISANNQIGDVRGVVAGSSADGGWGWHAATSNLERAFLADNNDTVRLVRTIMKEGQPVWGDPNASGTGLWNSNINSNTSGRNWRKYYVPRALRDVPGKGYTNRWTTIPYILIRYAGVVLIDAEANAQLGNSVQALTDLNMIRQRVKLPPLSGLSGQALLNAIYTERRLEFAGEMTYRWDDLHRIVINGKLLIDDVLGPTGSFVQYNDTCTDPLETMPGHSQETGLKKGSLFRYGVNELLPIPQSEVDASNKVVTQNPGY